MSESGYIFVTVQYVNLPIDQTIIVEEDNTIN